VQLDWFTLAAQIVNFAILVFLLQRFLYGPIVRAMEQREENIASRLREAERKRAEADQEVADYRQQQEELKGQRERIAARAEEEVAEQRQQLLEQARDEVEQIEQRWHEAIKREQQQFLRALRDRASEQVVDMVRRVLVDLADADLEHQIIEVFIRQLREMGMQQRKEMSESIQRSGGKVVIRSTYDIPDGLRKTVVAAIRDELFDGGDIQPKFERTDELVCGVELRADGRRLAWTVENYLNGIEERVRAELDQEISVQDQDQGIGG
jgi:F-type H+-transporting ATPase subunit b